MQVELSGFVQSDLGEIADYIAQDSPVRALGFIRKVRGRFTAIGRNPLIYLPVIAPSRLALYIMRS